MMETVGFYLFKSAVWITGFALVYFLFLRNERFFRLNRVYLLAGMLVSAVLPLITIRYVVEMPVGDAVVAAGPLSGEVAEHSVWQRLFPVLLCVVWIAGVLFFLMRYIIQIIPVMKAAGTAVHEPGCPVKLIRSPGFSTSFSLFSFVVVNPSVSETETREILNHEMVHIRQKHWIDLLLSAVMCAVQWFNPAAWIYSRFIKQNHEYMADEGALQRTSDPAVYRATLLNQITGTPVIDLGNFFSYSLNKKRFYMMKNKISSPYRKLKLLLILPVAAFVLYAFAVPEYRIANGPEGSVSPVVASVSKQVKGVILNEEGVPLEGATIVIKGSTTGTSSDNHGKFSLKDVPEDGVLVISYVGYETALFTVSGKTEISVRMKKKDVVMETVKVTPGPPPPPPPPPPSKSAWNVEGDPLIIVDGFKSDKDLSGISPDDIQSVTVLKGERATEKYGDAGKEGVVEVTMKKHAAKDDVTSEKNDGRVKVTMKKKPEVSNDKDDDEVFVVVEDMPLFPEGNEAIMQWINGKIKYPEEAIAQKISGRVVVGFTISASGKVTDVKVAKSVHPLLDAEAIRVIKSMPDWKPGTQHGKPVDVRYMIPVEFNLNATGGEKVVR